MGMENGLGDVSEKKVVIKDNNVCCQIKMFFAHLEDKKNKVLLGVRLKKTRSF